MKPVKAKRDPIEILDHAWIPAAFAVGVAVAVVSCLTPKSPVSQVTDVSSLIQCVSKDWGEPVLTIAGDCSAGEVAVVEDAIADIELLAEENAGLSTPSDAGTNDAGQPPAVAALRASFPYSGNPRISVLLQEKRWR